MMRNRLIFDAVILVVVFGSIWGIFAILPVWPQKTPSGISVEKEEKIGALLLKATLASGDFDRIENDTLKAALDTVKNRLVQSLPAESKYYYQIIPVNSNMANAFALPGGYIIITDDLLSLLKSPEECAAVMAHEMGHIEKKHTLTKLLANFSASILFGDNAMASEAAELLTTSAYSRRQEEKADNFGLGLLEEAGINPHVMGTAFRHLKDDPEYFDMKMEIIMSHPDIDSRIKNAYDYPVKKDFRERKLEVDWKAINRFYSSEISMSHCL